MHLDLTALLQTLHECEICRKVGLVEPGLIRGEADEVERWANRSSKAALSDNTLTQQGKQQLSTNGTIEQFRAAMMTRMCFVLHVEKMSGAWVGCLLTLRVFEPRRGPCDTVNAVMRLFESLLGQ